LLELFGTRHGPYSVTANRDGAIMQCRDVFTRITKPAKRFQLAVTNPTWCVASEATKLNQCFRQLLSRPFTRVYRLQHDGGRNAVRLVSQLLARHDLLSGMSVSRLPVMGEDSGPDR
jgi:hypothetical protein